MHKALAWFVHLYTASGGIFALLSVIAISNHDWALSMIWMFVCFFIDGSDGLLARKFRVREVLPNIDGKSIDYVIDFLTYAFIPAYFTFASNLLSPNLRLPASILIVLTSAIYYGRQGMVSSKNQFSGFPVLWNLVIFYEFFIFQFNPTINALLIVAFGALHFAPVQVSYPSKNIRKNPLPFIIGITMLCVIIGILIIHPQRNNYLIGAAWAGFIYFFALSVFYTWWYKV